MNLEKIKAFIKKYFTKTTLIVALVVFSVLGIGAAMNSCSNLQKARADLSSYQILYGSVQKERHRLDSLVKAYQSIIKERDLLIAAKDGKIFEQGQVIYLLKDSLKTTVANATAATADSSYKYIQETYPPITKLEYCFDSAQVKIMHVALVQRNGLLVLVKRYEDLITNLKENSILKDSQIADLKSLNVVLVNQKILSDTENKALAVENKGLKKSVKQQKFFKFLGTSAGVAASVIILLIHSSR